MKDGRNMKKDILIVGFSMFAIFFGSGNLIFPPQIGLVSGDGLLPAVIGLGLSGVLFPMLAVAAIANTGNSLEDMMKHINPWWHKLFMAFGLMIVVFGTIPRCGGVAYETGFLGITGSDVPAVTKWLFLGAFFFIAYMFARSRSGMVDRIGNYLTPFLLIALLIIIVLAIVDPIGDIGKSSVDNTFINAFLTGYNTGDVGTGIVCGALFISAFKEKGYVSRKDKRTVMTGVIIIGFVLLFSVYAGLAYLGAQGVGQYPADVDQTFLLSDLVTRLAGYGGFVVLAVAVILACLTTAAGMIGTAGGWINDWTKGKISYNVAAAAIATAIFLVSSAGVSNVLAFSGPLFTLLFPMSVVMTVLGLFRSFVPNDGTWKGAVYTAFGMSIFDALNAYVGMGYISLDMSGINKILGMIPLAEYGFTWLVPTIIGCIAGTVIFKLSGKESLPYVE